MIGLDLSAPFNICESGAKVFFFRQVYVSYGKHLILDDSYLCTFKIREQF